MVKPCSLSAADGASDLLNDHRREALGRLVEQEKPRAGAQDARRWRASAARRRRAWCPGCASRSGEVRKQLEDARERQPARLDLRRQHQVFLDVEAREDAALLRTDRDAGAGDAGSSARASSSRPRTAPSRCGCATMPMIDFKRRGLAGAVAAQQRDDLARVDVEGRRRAARGDSPYQACRSSTASSGAAALIMAGARDRPRAPPGSSTRSRNRPRPERGRA